MDRKELHMEKRSTITLLIILVMLAVAVFRAEADVVIQCPCPAGTSVSPDTGNIECVLPGPPVREVACRHITGGDGFINMADGSSVYIFGFADVTGLPASEVMTAGELAASAPGPLIVVREGQELYLTLTTLPLKLRPDLFDPHTIHWHGFPNASAILDGEPMASIAINPGASLTYYYKAPAPGTYMYHCHMEATEHMQMGMLGNLYVKPAQDGISVGGFTTFAYNDLNGLTGYDIDYPLQIISFDPDFHNANLNVQPLPFADMTDTYPLMNGRGYPDTINPSADLGASPDNGFQFTQPMPSLITATQGEMILLRMSSLATVRFYTLISPGIPMKVIGKDAMILRGSGQPSGTELSYVTNSITLGGGQSVDVLLDTSLVTPGTYVLYTSNFNELSNNNEDFGGMMTEIVITP